MVWYGGGPLSMLIRLSLPMGGALMAAGLATACDGSGELVIPPGYQHRPAHWVVAWPNEPQRHLVLSLDRWTLADADRIRCSLSSVYEVTSRGTVRTVANGLNETWCGLVTPHTVSAAPDGRSLVAGDEGRVLQWDLARGGRDSLTLSGLGRVFSPAISPDGTRIAFIGEPTDSSGAEGQAQFLYAVGRDGEGLRQIGGYAGRYVTSLPSWAPDMSSIVVSASDRTQGLLQPGRLIVTDIRDGTQRTIGSGYEPSWSPDGRWIAFIRSIAPPVADQQNGLPSDTDYALYLRAALELIDKHGDTSRRVFANPDTVMTDPAINWLRGLGGPIVWSPDGQRIAFTRALEDGTSAWVIGVDGSELRRLVDVSEKPMSQ